MKKVFSLLFFLSVGYLGWGQVTTTINFDNSSNWIQSGLTLLTSYASHGYNEGYINITGTNILRQTTTTQDGFAGALGTYSVRLENNSTSKLEVQITGYGEIREFGFKIRRWDSSPATNFTVEYSTNNGTSWNAAGTINNTLLTTSNWENYTYAINPYINISPNEFILRIKSNGTTERVMIDDIYFTSTATLPVTITTYNAQINGKNNIIYWSTASEQNNSGFNIERSTNGTDFENIGFVKSLSSNGNSSSRLDYSFTDFNPIGLNQYYRLKQTDFDGTRKYSAIVMVRREAPTALTLTKVYPNPANSSIYINASVPTKMDLQFLIIDVAGRVVSTKNVFADVGNNGFDMTVEHLKSGTYFIKAISKEQGVVATEKFIKF
jgi:hypothetical protein